MKMKTTNLIHASCLATAFFIIVSADGLSAATLQQAVQKTLQSNPEIQAGIQARNASEQNLKLSRSDYYPEIYLAAAVGDENTDSPYTRSLASGSDSIDLTRKEVALVVKQLIYDGLATPQTVETSKSRLQASDMRLLAVMENISLRTTQVYLAVLREQQLLALAKENLQAHDKIYKSVKQRADRGVGRKADLNQVEGRLALAESQLIASETNLYNAKINYLRVVGDMPEDDMLMPASLASALPVNLQEALDVSLQNNPRLKSAMAEVMAANAQRKVARSGFYPQLDLVFEQNWDENLDGVEGDNDGYSLMLKLRYNLFNGGGDRARSRQAAFRAEESKALQDRTQREIVEDLNLAWTTYKAVRNQLIYLKQHVDASAQTQDAYDKQFNIGKRTLLDLLDARNELFQAKRAYASAQHDSLYQQYRILATMGMLARQFNE